MEIKVLIGKRIKHLRESKGLSQEKLAGLTGLDRTYLWSIEKGRRNISIEVLFRICKSLNTSLHVLLKDIDNDF